MEADKQQDIYAYLSGKMDESGRRAFEAACGEDAELRQLLTEAVQMQFLLKETAKASFKPASPLQIFPRPSWVYGLAAGIALILLLALFRFFSPFSAPSPQELYASHYTLPEVSMLRDSNAYTDSLWLQISQVYAHKAWAQSEKLLDTYIKLDSPNQHLQAPLLLGISRIQLNKWEEALEAFKVIAHTSHPYYYDARWYEALIYLKREEITECKKSLSLLENSKVYGEKAKSIMNRIE